MVQHQTLIKRAIKKVGSQKKLAEAIGLSQQGVSYLLNSSSRVSAEVAIKIERATAGEISRAELRPDLFSEAA